MKIAFDSTYHWNFSAPTIEAESVRIDGFFHRYRVLWDSSSGVCSEQANWRFMENQIANGTGIRNN